MRFGELIAFGTIQFSGVGAVSRAVSGWPLSFEASYDTGLISVGKAYPFDTQGLSAAPLKDPVLTFEYILYAGIGIPAGQAFAALEAQWRSIFEALQGFYAWNGATSTGQKGDLIVADADPASGATYMCPARVLKPAPWKLKPGSPYALSVEIPFCPLGDFRAV